MLQYATSGQPSVVFCAHRLPPWGQDQVSHHGPLQASCARNMGQTVFVFNL